MLGESKSRERSRDEALTARSEDNCLWKVIGCGCRVSRGGKRIATLLDSSLAVNKYMIGFCPEITYLRKRGIAADVACSFQSAIFALKEWQTSISNQKRSKPDSSIYQSSKKSDANGVHHDV